MTPARVLPLLALLATGCKGGQEPAWAIDPIWIEPTEDGIHGFQTWQLYTKKWEKKQKDSTYLCSVLVELEGVTTECTDCQVAWATTATFVESDCEGSTADSDPWLALERLSIGLALNGDVQHPGQTVQGFADYGWGWEIHGQAWPEAAERGDKTGDGTWSGEEPFSMWPELAWPL